MMHANLVGQGHNLIEIAEPEVTSVGKTMPIRGGASTGLHRCLAEPVTVVVKGRHCFSKFCLIVARTVLEKRISVLDDESGKN